MGITAALKVIFLLFGRVTGGNLLTSRAVEGWAGGDAGKVPSHRPNSKNFGSGGRLFLARGLSERGETWEEPSWIVD